MPVITIKVDTKDVERYLTDVQRKRVPVATQRAMIKTAQAIKEAEIDEMKRVFDRPTRWTLGAMKVGPRKNFTITVGILDPDGYYKRANYYLGTQVVGGSRKHKAFELALQRGGVMPYGWFAVPGEKAKKDPFGNMSVGEIKQIMSWFNAAEPYSGSTQNMTPETRAKRRKGTKKKRGFEYFYAPPGRAGKLHPGIYRRTRFGFGSAIEPILIFVKSARYRPRFDFEKIANGVYDKRFLPLFTSALSIE